MAKVFKKWEQWEEICGKQEVVWRIWIIEMLKIKLQKIQKTRNHAMFLRRIMTWSSFVLESWPTGQHEDWIVVDWGAKGFPGEMSQKFDLDECEKWKIETGMRGNFGRMTEPRQITEHRWRIIIVMNVKVLSSYIKIFSQELCKPS